MVVGPTDFQDLLQCDQIYSFHLIKIEAELFFVTIPALLTFVAVATVSVYALKLQIRLSREIQPQVNLPPEGIIPSSTRDVESSNKVKNSRTSNKITLGAQSSGPNWDDIQIVDLENSEEIRAPERIRTNRNGNEEEQESSFSIKRKNSDPSKFFRVPKETTSVPTKETECVGCLSPLSLALERILMINIPALCVAIDLIIFASMRLHLVVKEKEKKETWSVKEFIKCVHFFIIFTYVYLVRKRLCK